MFAFLYSSVILSRILRVKRTRRTGSSFLLLARRNVKDTVSTTRVLLLGNGNGNGGGGGAIDRIVDASRLGYLVVPHSPSLLKTSSNLASGVVELLLLQGK